MGTLVPTNVHLHCFRHPLNDQLPVRHLATQPQDSAQVTQYAHLKRIS